MSLVILDGSNKNYSQHINDAFKKSSKFSHPCIHQLNTCPIGGRKCFFVGLPNDICIFYIKGKCKYQNCKYKHDDTYATIYKNAKQEFIRNKNKILPMIAPYLKRSFPYLIAIFGLTFNYMMQSFHRYMQKTLS